MQPCVPPLQANIFAAKRRLQRGGQHFHAGFIGKTHSRQMPRKMPLGDKAAQGLLVKPAHGAAVGRI